jgi:hypothetical protein
MVRSALQHTMVRSALQHTMVRSALQHTMAKLIHFVVHLAIGDPQAELQRMLDSGELDKAQLDNGGGAPMVPREVKRAHVAFVDTIGSGQFGQVWKAMLDESTSGGRCSII